MAASPTIRRILTLKNFGVFRNFTTSADLPDFQRHNLIYGFNGSGKTTLARLFGSLETGTLRPELPEGGTFEVELSDGTLIQSSGAFDALRGRLLVFSVDFIEENLRWKDGTARPVFYLGKEQAELSEKLAGREAVMMALERSRSESQGDYGSKERALSAHKRDAARLIAEQLALGRRYDASNLVTDYDQRSYGEESLLSEAEQKPLRAVILQDAPLAKRQALISGSCDLAGLVGNVRDILNTTLGTIAIAELRDHDSMLRWVKEGEDYHRTHHVASCLLCGNILTEERLRALAHALDDKFDRLTKSITDAKSKAERLRDRLVALRGAIPSSNDISREHQGRFAAAVVDLRARLTTGVEAATMTLTLLERKVAAPNVSIEAEGLVPAAEAAEWDAAAAVGVASVNGIIDDHNRSHDEFQEMQRSARTKLKDHFLAQGRSRYLALQSEVSTANEQRQSLESEHGRLARDIEHLKQQMRQHGRAADMINRMIRGYLGHKELEITTLEEGYQLRRNGRPVTGSLSEGEKSAIALCYFLSTVEAEGRKRKDLIVVVDDPISSLDTRALNYAFSIIKASLSDAGQLIVLTHNLQFMNETKKWLKKKTAKEVRSGEATATLLFLDSVQDPRGETRSSSIKILPALIREYESEYQYLFHLVLEFSRSRDGETGYFYIMPNALRKVLEIFLAFRMPGSEGLSDKVENVAKGEHGIDPARIRALDRLVQLESHADNLDDLVTFSSMTIEETKAAADALLKVMEALDKGHHDRLSRICG